LIESCSQCGNSFEITEGDLQFYNEISPLIGEERHSIPSPKKCPACRVVQMLTWRNEFTYYSRKCDLCSKGIITVHKQDNPYPVYCHNCWWGDSWDPKDFGFEYDSSNSFFEQFHTLQQNVPQLAMMNDDGVQSENCEYCQDFAFGKNCYLVTGSWRIRDSMYSSNCNHGNDILDSKSINIECELVYASLDCQRIYNCMFLVQSADCHDCTFGFDLRGCSNCFCCVGLRKQSYCIFNEQYSEEDYHEKVAEFFNGSYSQLEDTKQLFDEFSLQFPRIGMYQLNCENCHGDNLFNCKEVTGFDTFNAEGCKFYYKGDSPQFSYDIYQSGNPKWCYWSVTPDDSYMTCFTTWCWKDKHVLYSDNCHSSEHLFGCIALKRGKNCILNKQYSADEYNTKLTIIVNDMLERGEWGEFFPANLSPFAYNETVAHEIMPLSESECNQIGLRWLSDDEKSSTECEDPVPDNIADCTDQITKTPLPCHACSKRYKVLPLELAFYRKMNLPIPRSCPSCRRRKRHESERSLAIFERDCEKCGKTTETSYAPDRQEIVYCESCYLEKVH